MMRQALAAIGLALLVSPALTAPALAQQGTPPRCALLGQMAVSSWLEMMGALSRQEVAAIDPALTRLQSLSATYTTLGCDLQVLGAAMDCLLTDAGDSPPRDLAQACMGSSGLTEGE